MVKKKPKNPQKNEHMEFSKQAVVLTYLCFSWFVEMCSSSEELLAGYVQAFIATEKELTTEYRAERNSPKACAGLQGFKI